MSRAQNVAIEYRWAESQYDRLPALAAELVRRQVAVIAARRQALGALRGQGGNRPRSPSSSSAAEDPVRLGLVTSLTRPGGNLTGVSFFERRAWHRKASRAPARAGARSRRRRRAAQSAKSPIRSCRVAAVEDAAAARSDSNCACPVGQHRRRDRPGFCAAWPATARRALVGADLLFFGQRNLIVALAARHRIPTMYHAEEFARSAD